MTVSIHCSSRLGFRLLSRSGFRESGSLVQYFPQGGAHGWGQVFQQSPGDFFGFGWAVALHFLFEGLGVNVGVDLRCGNAGMAQKLLDFNLRATEPGGYLQEV